MAIAATSKLRSTVSTRIYHEYKPSFCVAQGNISIPIWTILAGLSRACPHWPQVPGLQKCQVGLRVEEVLLQLVLCGNPEKKKEQKLFGTLGTA